LHVDPAERGTYIENFTAVVTQAQSSPGCLDFAISPDLLDPGRINVYERWNSTEELYLFRGSGPDEAQQATILDADVCEYPVTGSPDRS
jgi:heme-degrading monooxygenase HmoA